MDSTIMGKEVSNALQAKGKDVTTWEVKVNDQPGEGSKDEEGEWWGYYSMMIKNIPSQSKAQIKYPSENIAYNLDFFKVGALKTF